MTDLATLNEAQILRLWDVLWLTPDQQQAGLEVYGQGFEKQFIAAVGRQYQADFAAGKTGPLLYLIAPLRAKISDRDFAALVMPGDAATQPAASTQP